MHLATLTFSFTYARITVIGITFTTRHTPQRLLQTLD